MSFGDRRGDACLPDCRAQEIGRRRTWRESALRKGPDTLAGQLKPITRIVLRSELGELRQQEPVELDLVRESPVLVVGEVGMHLDWHSRIFELVLACEDLSCMPFKERYWSVHHHLPCRNVIAHRNA